MKTGKILSCMIIFAILVIPMTMAAADINLRTISGHRASITILGAGEAYEFLDSFHQDTGNGELKVVYTGDKGEIDIIVKITKEGETIMNERFDEMSTSGPLYLQVIPGKVSDNYLKLDEEKAKKEAEEAAKAQAAAETPEEKTSEEEKKTPESGSVTGSAIEGTDLKIPKGAYYIVGAIIIVGLLAFLGLKFGGNIGFSSLSTGAGAVQTGNEKSYTERKLEARLKAAQDEINRLKKEEENIEKIVAVEKRLEADKEELRRLRGGRSDDKSKLVRWGE